MSWTYELINTFYSQSGFSAITWHYPVMWLISSLFIYLGIKKGVEPLLLLPIGFSSLIVNLPLGGLLSPGGHGEAPGLFYLIFEKGLRTELIPCIVFLGLGALTDFGPLLANPKTFLLGASAQFGVYVAMFGAIACGFNLKEACSIGIIGGADGPTTIYTTINLLPDRPEFLAATAVSAYSYMAMVPIIQPPIIKLLTTKKERGIVMKQLRKVSKTEKILFPIIVSVVICLLVPKAAPLIGMFMLGNLFRESGVVERLTDASQNALMNIVIIFLGIGVGSTMVGTQFLRWYVIKVYLLGLVAFAFSTAGGVLFAKIMNLFLKEKINPVIGAAGVSAVPMSARVAHKIAQEANPKCYLLMFAMGPNVAGVIGTIVAAGYFLALAGSH